MRSDRNEIKLDRRSTRHELPCLILCLRLFRSDRFWGQSNFTAVCHQESEAFFSMTRTSVRHERCVDLRVDGDARRGEIDERQERRDKDSRPENQWPSFVGKLLCLWVCISSREKGCVSSFPGSRHDCSRRSLQSFFQFDPHVSPPSSLSLPLLHAKYSPNPKERS